MICTLCWQLLGNILSWHGLVGTQLLQRLALDGLLNRYIVLGLANSHVNRHSMEKCQAVSLLLFSLKSRGLFMQVKTFGSGTLCFIYTWLSQNTDVSHCHHTNFTLTLWLLSFCINKSLYCIYIQYILFTHSFYTLYTYSYPSLFPLRLINFMYNSAQQHDAKSCVVQCIFKPSSTTTELIRCQYKCLSLMCENTP